MCLLLRMIKDSKRKLVQRNWRIKIDERGNKGDRGKKQENSNLF